MELGRPELQGKGQRKNCWERPPRRARGKPRPEHRIGQNEVGGKPAAGNGKSPKSGKQTGTVALQALISLVGQNQAQAAMPNMKGGTKPTLFIATPRTPCAPLQQEFLGRQQKQNRDPSHRGTIIEMQEDTPALMNQLPPQTASTFDPIDAILNPEAAELQQHQWDQQMEIEESEEEQQVEDEIAPQDPTYVLVCLNQGTPTLCMQAGIREAQTYKVYPRIKDMADSGVRPQLAEE